MEHVSFWALFPMSRRLSTSRGRGIFGTKGGGWKPFPYFTSSNISLEPNPIFFMPITRWEYCTFLFPCSFFCMIFAKTTSEMHRGGSDMCWKRKHVKELQLLGVENEGSRSKLSLGSLSKRACKIRFLHETYQPFCCFISLTIRPFCGLSKMAIIHYFFVFLFSLFFHHIVFFGTFLTLFAITNPKK